MSTTMTDVLVSKGFIFPIQNISFSLFFSLSTNQKEVIEFFKTGYLFNIKGCESGMKSMLRLLYIHTGQDKNEKGEAVIRAYHSVLFQTDLEGRLVRDMP